MSPHIAADNSLPLTMPTTDSSSNPTRGTEVTPIQFHTGTVSPRRQQSGDGGRTPGRGNYRGGYVGPEGRGKGRNGQGKARGAHLTLNPGGNDARPTRSGVPRKSKGDTKREKAAEKIRKAEEKRLKQVAAAETKASKEEDKLSKAEALADELKAKLEAQTAKLKDQRERSKQAALEATLKKAGATKAQIDARLENQEDGAEGWTTVNHSKTRKVKNSTGSRVKELTVKTTKKHTPRSPSKKGSTKKRVQVSSPLRPEAGVFTPSRPRPDYDFTSINSSPEAVDAAKGIGSDLKGTQLFSGDEEEVEVIEGVEEVKERTPFEESAEESKEEDEEYLAESPAADEVYYEDEEEYDPSVPIAEQSPEQFFAPGQGGSLMQKKNQTADEQKMVKAWLATQKDQRPLYPAGSYTPDHSEGRSNMSGDMDLDAEVIIEATQAIYEEEDKAASRGRHRRLGRGQGGRNNTPPHWSDASDDEELLEPSAAPEGDQQNKAEQTPTKFDSFDAAAKLAASFSAAQSSATRHARQRVLNPQDLVDTFNRAAPSAKSPTRSHPVLNPGLAAAHRPVPTTGGQSNLRQSSYAQAKHGEIHVNEKPLDTDSDILHVGKVELGTPGHEWFLTLGIMARDGLSNKETLLGGLGATIQILSAVIPNFALLPVDSQHTHMATVNSHLVEEGMPASTAIALFYFKTRNMFMRNSNNTQQNAPTPPSAHRFDDDAAYSGPSYMYGTIKVSGEVNVKDICENLRWDIEDTGLKLMWKNHQSSESSTQVVLIGVPRVFCMQGLSHQVLFLLKKCEKDLIKKGKISHNYIDLPLPKLHFAYRHMKKGKVNNRAAQNLSLNNLQAFRDNGCFVLHIEGAPSDWPRLMPLYNHAHKSGLLRQFTGRKVKLVQMYNGSPDGTDIVMMQRLKRAHVVITSVMLPVNLPNIETLYKVVEVEMQEGFGEKPRKFTSLLREFFDLRVEVPGSKDTVPVIHAIFPCMQGLSTGSARAIVRHDCAAAMKMIADIKKCVAPWWWGYWTKVLGYTEPCARKLMESFDTEAAHLAGFSVFDVEKLTCEGEFMDGDGYLDEIEEEFGIDSGFGEEDQKMDLSEARELHQQTLGDRDDMSECDRSGPSRRTNFSQSTGNSTNRSVTTERLAVQHKDRALKNVALTRDNADLLNDNEKLRRELQEAREAAASAQGGVQDPKVSASMVTEPVPTASVPETSTAHTTSTAVENSAPFMVNTCK